MFTDKEYSDYEESLHNLWDITNAMSDAEAKGFGKGEAKGRAEGRAEGLTEGATAKARDMAKKMLQKNKPIEEIIEFTELSEAEILSIKASLT